MKFKHKNNKILFLDPQCNEPLDYLQGEKINLIVSPSLYWVKKLSFPISSVREVKKLLPSIFEDSLPQAHYSYTAYKSGDDFITFAYEDKRILDTITAQGIHYADIAGVYFAQSEFETLDGAMQINKQQSIYLEEQIVVVVPSSWLKEVQALQLKEIQLSKHSIKLQQFGHIVDNTSLYKIGAILSILSFILVVEIFITSTKRDTILEAKDTIFKKHKLQATMMQNSATMHKYSKIYKTQTKLREYLAYFLKMPLQNSQKITLIEFKNDTLYVTISGVAKGAGRTLIAKLNSKKLTYKLSYSNNTIRVEIKV